MAHRSELQELITAWRALAGESTKEGWSTISVATDAPCKVLAGRRFPGNGEALLLGFLSAKLPLNPQLPEGRGFVVMRAELGESGAGRSWLAICRQSSGSLELFALMAEDLVLILSSMGDASEDRLLAVFLSRIRAWQEFMRRGEDSLLGPDAECGLYGELEILKEMIQLGIPPTVATQSWQGPLGANQDFLIATGGMEVKSTVSEIGFLARIASLEQLDYTLVTPLFLVGVRLALDDSGNTLPMQVQLLRHIIAEEEGPLDIFDNLLLRAGYVDSVASQYTRRFLLRDYRVWLLSNDFPLLSRSNVPLAIRRVRYEIDLDLATGTYLSLHDAFCGLGVID